MAHNLANPNAQIPQELIALTRSVTPEQFERLCLKYRDLRLELTSTGELIVMAPAGMQTGVRNANLTSQLTVWTKKDATGVCFDSSTIFALPNKALRSPDASWIRREKWDCLSERQKERFGPFCPDFVVELRSQRDRLQILLNKMSEYSANGASLGWLIDPSTRRVYVYRPDEEVVVLENPESVSGEPLLPGFTLQTAELW
jgi:Uma2 family endonuclease